MLSKCNFMGTLECTQFGREPLYCVPIAKNTMNSPLTVHSRNLTYKGKSINLLQSHQNLQHTRGIHKEVAEPHQHASCQFCAVGRQGWAQVCSSAYCSLAWVNKEKTGAIRQTCQAWNSLLMFTPFTLELSQHCCRSPDFLTRPNCDLFFTESEQTIPVVCHRRHITLGWQTQICLKDKRFKKPGMLKRHWGHVLP